MIRVLAHTVVYRSALYLESHLESLEREGRSAGISLTCEVTLNGPLDPSSGPVVERCQERFSPKIYRNERNLGFSGAHNQAATRFLEGNYDFFLVINPDLALQEGALLKLTQAAKSFAAQGIVAPLLIRADEKLCPLHPERIDSAGITFTNSLRHFDTFAGEPLDGREVRSGYVIGATGACLLFSRGAVTRLILPNEPSDSPLFSIFPDLQVGHENRKQLFEESFFAYREDAELSLRANKLRCPIYLLAQAVGYHVRVVTPERRKLLSPEINYHSVRNRFLLQLFHWSPFTQPASILPGFILRNLLVIGSLLFIERSSLGALKEFLKLIPVGLRRRRQIAQAAKTPQ